MSLNIEKQRTFQAENGTELKMHREGGGGFGDFFQLLSKKKLLKLKLMRGRERKRHLFFGVELV